MTFVKRKDVYDIFESVIFHNILDQIFSDNNFENKIGKLRVLLAKLNALANDEENPKNRFVGSTQHVLKYKTETIQLLDPSIKSRTKVLFPLTYSHKSFHGRA